MRIVGIDPGKKGAAALIESRRSRMPTLTIVDIPILEHGKSWHLHHRHFRDQLALWGADFIYVENVWARPLGAKGKRFTGHGMSTGTSNKLMKLAGAIENAAACACELGHSHLVTAQVWKEPFGLIGLEYKAAKRDARAMCARLFPAAADLVKRVTDDGRAEAALIATFGAMRQGIIRLEKA